MTYCQNILRSLFKERMPLIKSWLYTGKIPRFKIKSPLSRRRPLMSMFNFLLSHHFKLYFCCVAIAKINGCFISTEFFYFINDADLSAINFIPFLFADGTADLERRNTTEDLTAGSGFSADFNGASFSFAITLLISASILSSFFFTCFILSSSCLRLPGLLQPPS